MQIIKTEKQKRFPHSILVKRLYQDHVFESAASLSFYFLFSVFPLAIVVSAALSTLNISHEDLDVLARIIPSQIVQVIFQYLGEITPTRTVTLILTGIGLTFYSLGKAIQTLKRKFRIAYGNSGTGSIIREWIISCVMVLLMLSSFYLTLILVVIGTHLIHWLDVSVVSLSDFMPIIQTFRYVILTAFLFFVLFGLYYLLPGRKQKMRDVLPGTLFSLSAWVLSSWAFSFYVDRIADYATVYGSLGTIIMLITWLFLVNVILLIGAYINSITKQT